MGFHDQTQQDMLDADVRAKLQLQNLDICGQAQVFEEAVDFLLDCLDNCNARDHEGLGLLIRFTVTLHNGYLH